ncbi:MAG TPA: hypothetical protein PK614_05570 [Nitrospira sp.]|nr:hypothetical protein [Nitrospira sp.]
MAKYVVNTKVNGKLVSQDHQTKPAALKHLDSIWQTTNAMEAEIHYWATYPKLPAPNKKPKVIERRERTKQAFP